MVIFIFGIMLWVEFKIIGEKRLEVVFWEVVGREEWVFSGGDIVG